MNFEPFKQAQVLIEATPVRTVSGGRSGAANSRFAGIEQRLWLGLTVSPDQRTIPFTAYKPINYDLMPMENFRWGRSGHDRARALTPERPERPEPRRPPE
jgi:hypothetical protein